MEELIQKWNEIKESVKIEYEISDIAYGTFILPLKVGEIRGN